MATKKIEEQSTAELQKLAKTYKTIIGVYIGFFIVYLGVILYLMYIGKASTALVTTMSALIVLFMPIHLMRNKVNEELKKRGEAV